MITAEYPPVVTGGAGVHVEHLVRHLREHLPVEVILMMLTKAEAAHLIPLPRPSDVRVRTIEPSAEVAGQELLEAISADVLAAFAMDSHVLGHTHHWNTHWAGWLGRSVFGIPHVMTLHSFEPSRFGRRERLGRGYALAQFMERTAVEHADAVIAVSQSVAAEVRRFVPGIDPSKVLVISNGIDRDRFWPDGGTDHLEGVSFDIDGAPFDWERPFVLFVGRISRQKGLIHLLRAMHGVRRDAALVIHAGAPASPTMLSEHGEEIARLTSAGRPVVLIDHGLPPEALRQLYSHASVLCSPSMNEPFGMVNLEAHACGTPVVASAIGGIPEIVVDGVTGYLVTVDAEECMRGSREAQRFVDGLTRALTAVLEDAEAASRMGSAARRRASRAPTWEDVARETSVVYERVLKAPPA